MFALSRDHMHLVAEGVIRPLGSAGADTLEADIQRFFHDRPTASGQPALLVGALPFDRARPPALWQPQTVTTGTGRGPLASALLAGVVRGWQPLTMTASANPEAYAAMVRQALRLIDSGQLQKVVLARSLTIRASHPVDPLMVARRLAIDSHATIFCAQLPAGPDAPPTALVGATPELLIRRQGHQVFSHPLAGSAARSRDGATDQAAARQLLQSAKDQREHALVVEAILDQLAPHCEALGAPEGTTLYSTATMWHLGTRIVGQLKAGAPSAAGLAALLHPTPAVGGVPRQQAIRAIAAIEPENRGYYAGAIGWVDGTDDGEWHVTLRCAEIRDTLLTLHAGAGIVSDSDPHAEAAETTAKFRAILRALEMDGEAEHLALAS